MTARPFSRWRYFAERNARKNKRLPRGRQVSPAPPETDSDIADMDVGFTVSAKILRADGSVEDLGIIAQHAPGN